ncbi:thiol-activated cytolysin family protein [Parabacteroides sp. AF14-59]|uniref:thiol-activated cytolysin family protein n=1 Tax=Parabacteroides sp. AF14-59 TaxID=2292240 RepID=UPI001F3FC673|nr:thiol-activated cytolysin family protein [Parabacteroides sp. AF14-59]
MATEIYLTDEKTTDIILILIDRINLTLIYKIMKKNYFLALLICLLVSSCTDDTMENQSILSESTVLTKYPIKEIVIKTENKDRFRSLMLNNLPATKAGYLLKDSIWTNGGGHSMIYETNEYTLTPDIWKYIYVGSLLKGGSIENQRFTPLSNRIEPIKVSYSFPARWVVDEIPIPALTAQRQSIQNIMNKEGMSGTQLVSFSYDMNQFSYYDELKLEFGCNINIGTLLNINININKGKIRNKTGLVAKFVQKNFTLDMDLPLDGCILLNNGELSGIRGFDPVYISSITFGRLGIITLDSKYSFDELSVAVSAALTAKVVNGNLNISAYHKQILSESNLKITIIGGKSDGSVKTVEGFEEFKNFLINGGTYSAQNPGDPIFYTASYLSDNSPFYSRFRIDIQN